MSVSAVGSSSSVIAAAFRQSRAADARTGAQRTPGGAAEASPEGGAADGSTPAIKALRQQLAEAQEALQRLVDARADEQAIRAAQQRVHACASALAAALTQQAQAAERASTGRQYA
ncbi:hypothetical protein [Modestobacter italicus]|uniref:hypothetical protein n=1 Tax=Modestobacter italicus (strain DSM 44449 / CECT 9708 / BC 501) TaxID=2732864 RepID=UPI001C94D9B1|nr:hypothetical protein [Modestobacter italicus]